jgi:hypothetical protein
MPAIKKKIPISCETDLDLAALRNQCYEIQSLIFTACEEPGYSVISLPARAFFKALKSACKKLRQLTKDDELALICDQIAGLAKLAIHATTGKQDLPSIEKIMVGLLNEYRSGAGLPNVGMCDLVDIEIKRLKDDSTPKANARINRLRIA